jgi:hypothetical protein
MLKLTKKYLTYYLAFFIFTLTLLLTLNTFTNLNKDTIFLLLFSFSLLFGLLGIAASFTVQIGNKSKPLKSWRSTLKPLSAKEIEQREQATDNILNEIKLREQSK